MSPKEIGVMIRKLRKGEKVTCPECNKGVIFPVGDYKITHGFYCDKCGFKINID